jgi:hypothetical protein
MKYFVFIFLLILSLHSFSQKNIRKEVRFYVKGELVEDVKYYRLLENDSLYQLEKDSCCVSFENVAVGEEIIVLMLYNEKQFLFYTIPSEIIYLKIEIIGYKLIFPFKRIFIVDEGLGYIKYVSYPKKKYIVN